MDPVAEEIISMEEKALTRWGKGDPDGFLEITARDVVYFDPYQETRVDGKDALTALYENLRGKVFFDRFEIMNPIVQASGNFAILTYNYVSFREGKPTLWNCTEVYRREPDGGWWIIQTHWSYTNAPKYG